MPKSQQKKASDVVRRRGDRGGLRTVDLFSGCGGMSLGFERAGFELVGAFDAWPAAIACYQENFSHYAKTLDLSDIKTSLTVLSDLAPDVIIGGPPCQDFSSAGKRIELDRADLTLSFAKIIETLRPRGFVMENVERARLSQAYNRARGVFSAAGYETLEVVLDASFFGVPQKRKRFFCIGILDGSIQNIQETLDQGKSSKRMTIRDYLGLEFGLTRYYRHPRNYSRRGIYSIDEPSATVRGVNRPVPPGYPGHHLDAGPVTQDLRPLTTFERARIQTFPKNFRLSGTKTDLELLVGNAVPVELAHAVASALKGALTA